jgi:hypothetical protein
MVYWRQGRHYSWWFAFERLEEPDMEDIMELGARR